MTLRRLLLLWIVVALVLGACGSERSGGTAEATGPPARNAAPASLLPPDVASLPTFDVETYQRLLTQLRGTPIVVNVWASWCVPCKAEAPLLHDAAAHYADRIQFLGVDILDSIEGGRGFIADHAIPYPSVFDPSGAIRDSMGLIGQPVTVFYDAAGTVVSTWDGQLSDQALQRGIRKALG